MQHNYKLTSITFADENENQVNDILWYSYDIFFKTNIKLCRILVVMECVDKKIIITWLK